MVCANYKNKKHEIYFTTDNHYNCIDAVFRMLQSQAFGQDVTLRRAPPPPLMASCLPSCLPDVMHVTLSPRPFSPFLHTTSDQKL